MTNEGGVLLAIVTDKKEYKIGEKILAIVILDTGNKRANGVDVLLKYDPQYLKIQSSDGKESKTEGKLDPATYLATAASSFQIFPHLTVNSQEGIIYFSALAQAGKFLTRKHTVTQLTFKTLKAGSTSLRLEHQPGSTRDSNVAFAGRDILENVTPINIIIQ